MIGWALVTATIVAWPHGWAKLPAIGDVIPMFKISGGRELAEEVDAVRERVRERTGEEPLIIVDAYGWASQLAFYLDGRPTVYGAGSRVGYRASQYDYWEATDLSDPALPGRPAVLVRQPEEKWREHFKLRGLETVQKEPAIHAVTEYGGVRDQSPSS
jgi:hypothetical protein